MAAAGCRLLANPVKRSAMLVGAFVTETRYWWKLLRQIRGELQTIKPAVVVPIDSSAINLRIAGIAKRLGIPVCYYVAPQVWASRPWRVKKIRERVDTLCCVLPFEEKYFTERGVHGVYVGHPMFDEPADTPASDPTLLEPPLPGMKGDGLGRGGGSGRLAFGAAVGAGTGHGGGGTNGGAGGAPMAPRVALFPGSRRAEIDGHMTAMLEIASEIKGRYAGASFVAAAPSEERAWQIRHHLRSANTPVDIRVGSADAIIRWADLVLTKSGTATLQVARHGKPMVVIFAVPWWQWNVAKHFILTRHLALVNILAGRELVPEFIPFHGSPLPVARKCIELLSQSELRSAMRKELLALVEPLKPGGRGAEEGGAGGEAEGVVFRLAADRVAGEVLKLWQTPPASAPLVSINRQNNVA
jgi:lipid-A-disaccharide synthase